MNQIERLRDDLAQHFPGLVLELDPPGEDRGSWFLDARRGGDLAPIVVEWRPDRGFGLSTPEAEDFGVKPDEVYPNAKAAFERVAALVHSNGRTEPPHAMRLPDLRKRLGISQEELAARAGVKQANVSRIENRGDVLLSTLERVVTAMGASLLLRVRLPDGSECNLDVSSPRPL